MSHHLSIEENKEVLFVLLLLGQFTLLFTCWMKACLMKCILWNFRYFVMYLITFFCLLMNSSCWVWKVTLKGFYQTAKEKKYTVYCTHKYRQIYFQHESFLSKTSDKSASVSLNGTLKCREVACMFLPLVFLFTFIALFQSPHSFCFIFKLWFC